jgi:hypothetical protein
MSDAGQQLCELASMSMDDVAIADELATLRTQVEQLVAAQGELTKERDAYKQLYMQMLEHCRKLELGLLGQKAERLSPNDAQLSLQVLGSLLATTGQAAEPPTVDVIDEEIEPTAKVAAHTRRKGGRKPLPEHLPRIEVEVLPPEVQAEGTDAFERIGEETSETLERRPASVVVVRVVRGKFVRKDRERNAPTDADRCRARPPDRTWPRRPGHAR